MSKRVFQHPAEPATGKKYWRSLGQLENTPEFRGWLEREFPQGASELSGGEVSRRNFLQLMGASMALAGLSFAGCRRPEKHLIPFTKGVEWSIPGKALFYATSYPTRKGAQPLVVQTHDGRPTKIEGNPMHPVSKGATDIHAQSSILDLYDPERSRFFVHKEGRGDTAAFEKGLDELIAMVGDGTGLAFLLEDIPSPSRERLRGLVTKKLPKATWTVYEPLGAEPAAVFGGVTPVPAIEKADVILALDHDFLGNEGDVGASRAFSSRRAVTGPDSKMNRLYVVENRYTVTGGIADHRLRLPASQVGAFAVALAQAISGGKDAALDAMAAATKIATARINGDWVKYCAEDLVANKGRSLVLAGSRQPAAVQALVAAINAALGNLGKTIAGRKASSGSQTLPQLAKQISGKQVRALVIVGGNPAYNAPADLEWAKLQASVEIVVRVGYYEDETTAAGAMWHAPLAHYLESWGDGYAADGSYTAVQPMILPLYGAWSELDVLAKFAGLPKPAGPELVQETFKVLAKPADFTVAWAKFLHDGFLAGSAVQPGAITFDAATATRIAGEAPAPVALGEGSYEVVFTPCSKLDDGRFNNNGWLQEIPDPITKTTWDNVALVSPATAKKLGIRADGVNEPRDDGSLEMIEIKVGNTTLEIPALSAPGHADNSISIALGYGRKVIGRVGKGTGFDAYQLRTTAAPYIATGASVRVTGRSYPIAITQEHGVLEGRGADLTREATMGEYKENRNNKDYFKKMGMDAHIPKNVSLYSNPPLNDIHAWGMTVDLNVCTGCSACMVACQAENNIPIVGKEQVIKGREMHWIRTDRYFASEGDKDLDDPELVSQPMMCQHCENAPCETVCPVNATVHSEDGLNVMAYNRCIGTRYCANNCPFKVRRFNFFDYNQRDVLGRKEGKTFSGVYEWNLTAPKGMEDSLKLQKNPNVTVRMRGVMEKCTFCVQRIQEAKIATKVAVRDSGDVRIPADSFTSACAQVCPTGAITFGDINNKDSTVSRVRASERGYRLLEYLNVNSRVAYLARIRNPNMKMPGAEKIGAAMKSHHAHGGTHAPEAGGHH